MCATLLQSHYLCKILCPPHVSYHELVSTPADSHHKLALVLDVLVLSMLHVLQMCDSHKRQTNSQRRVPCDTISRTPIFMRLPAPVLQTLCRLRPIPTVASFHKRTLKRAGADEISCALRENSLRMKSSDSG